MKYPKITGLFVSLAAVALLLGGCGGSYQARSVDLKNSLLVNPDILEKGASDQALYRYQNPQAVFAQYSMVLIDPVIISKQAELSADELENYNKLANNFYVYLNQELSKQFTVVSTVGTGTMRIQVALVDADSSKPVRTVLSFTPIGIGLNILKYGATGKQTAVGEITGEIKITDALTGQLLAAALDRRVGGKNPKDIYDVWSNADEALQYWAKKTTFALCTAKGKPGCENPDK